MSSTLSDVTDTKAGTTEQGALKTIHRNYNKLNGFEAMLHIINRYKFVLYPFIILSILGSAYSFYNDYVQAFPMMSDYIKITQALFFSIMLEIVRDGSIIALFNAKMHWMSRTLVSLIFIGVTGYLFNTHIATKNIIERNAIDYSLTHQDDKKLSVTNPKFDTASQELGELQKDLTSKRAEKTTELIANSTSIHTKKRNDALTRMDKIEREVKDIQKDIKAKRAEIDGYKKDNITDIEDNQKLISNVLLTTLLIIESLAMLGAVIKFINKDNADKEVAKHSEIMESYENMSEQMRKTNDDLGTMLSKDVERAGKQNVAFIKAMADNRKMFQEQMNEVLGMMSSTPTFNFSQPMPKPIKATVTAQHQEEQPRPIGFREHSKEKLVKGLFQDGYLKENDKLTSKSMLINSKDRTEDKFYKEVMKELATNGVVEFKAGHGYYAKVSFDEALRVI